MKYKFIVLFLVLVVGSGIPVNGQKKTGKVVITGYVTDIHQYPVSGAVVVISTDGGASATTDEKGYFKMRVDPPAKNSIISVISSTLGVLEEALNGRTRINFTYLSSTPYQNVLPLNPEETYDKEKINIGYGSRERRELTSEVYKLDASDRRFDSYNSIYEMLQGSVPGVLVSGDRVLVRGITSLVSSNDPLYIVDGIPVTSIANIPPRFVKSIEVLKGSACAIYGSRGANGVILIDLIDATDLVDDSLPATGKVPFVTTQPPTNVHAKTVTLNGLVNPNDVSAVVTFEYGTTTSYGKKITAVQNPVTSAHSSKVSADISDLITGETYHYRVIATNSFGSTLGKDFQFETRGEAPSAETGKATETTSESAKLNGFVNAHFLPTDITFEYGTTTEYGNSIKVSQDPVNRNTHVLVNAEISGLKYSTTYHFRIVARNELGTTYGQDETFKAEYVIGDYLKGGYVFYIDETGEHGLLCAPSDQSTTAVWGDCMPEGAASRAVGTGNQNTTDIITGCSTPETAARLCHDLEMNGYSDWFLPSVNELYLMYTNLYEKGLGDFQRTYYWSSTQDKFGAWVVSFYYGSKSNHSRSEADIRTRAVRAF
jgi:TonB-dependent SusC/RagA subfamily outer membrane receptor